MYTHLNYAYYYSNWLIYIICIRRLHYMSNKNKSLKCIPQLWLSNNFTYKLNTNSDSHTLKHIIHIIFLIHYNPLSQYSHPPSIGCSLIFVNIGDIKHIYFYSYLFGFLYTRLIALVYKYLSMCVSINLPDLQTYTPTHTQIPHT